MEARGCHHTGPGIPQTVPSLLLASPFLSFCLVPLTKTTLSLEKLVFPQSIPHTLTISSRKQSRCRLWKPSFMKLHYTEIKGEPFCHHRLKNLVDSGSLERRELLRHAMLCYVVSPIHPTIPPSTHLRVKNPILPHSTQ